MRGVMTGECSVWGAKLNAPSTIPPMETHGGWGREVEGGVKGVEVNSLLF